MSKVGTIDLLRTPHLISSGDIVGVEQIPASVARVISGSSRTPIQNFKVQSEKPSMRGIVMQVIYNSQNQDSIDGLILMALAPHSKQIKVPNTEKNLMITNAHQIRSMGLDTSLNWRLNHTPFTLSVTKSHFGIDVSKVEKYGSVPDGLASTIAQHASMLGELGILDTMGLLTGKTLRRMSGSQNGRYENLTGNQVGRSFQGNKSDASVIAQAEAQRRADEKTAKLDAAREIRENQKSTPSGKLAWRCHVQFNDKANPDITLQTAYDIGIVGEMQLLVLEEVGKKSGLSTIRTLYDAFKDQHEKIQSDLIDTGACMEEDAISYKAEIEKDLKDTLVSFYDRIKRSGGKSEEIEKISVPYSPALPTPAAK